MPKARLQKLLSELHEELEDTREVDEDARGLLRELLGDIERTLGTASSEAGGHPSLEKRLRDSIEHFEQEHTTMALNIRRVLDALRRIS